MTSPRNLTKTTHKTAYPAISPTRPELSQAGKTVLVTGGATGIGFAIAKDIKSGVMQILSFHPGSDFTEAAQTAGHTETTVPWDDASLPGCFAVWAASPEAAFLHSRFLWAAWDVNELKTGEIGDRITSDLNYLKFGVDGL